MKNVLIDNQNGWILSHLKATKAGPRKRAQIRDEVMVYYKDHY